MAEGTSGGTRKSPRLTGALPGRVSGGEGAGERRESGGRGLAPFPRRVAVGPSVSAQRRCPQMTLFGVPLGPIAGNGGLLWPSARKERPWCPPRSLQSSAVQILERSLQRVTKR